MELNRGLSSNTNAADFSQSEILRLKYGPPATMGWGPRLRAWFGYNTPDDWYEAFLFETVTEETTWLDVGCGRYLFPSNAAGAQILSSRCRLLFGLDPSDNIDENPYVHQRAKCQIEEFKTDLRFDLITLRMVAEHIRNPKAVVGVLSRLVAPGGRVVIYTVPKWSPVSLVAAATPIAVHHVVKRWIWRTSEKDTFPTTYRMNTRGVLKRLFAETGLLEESFCYLDDCRTFQRWKISNFIELCVWKALRTIRLHYPETCILAVYKREGPT